MEPRAKVLVIEMVLPPDGERSFGHFMDLVMLTVLDARERNLDGYRALLQSAGLSLDDVIPLQSEPDRAILVASRA